MSLASPHGGGEQRGGTVAEGDTPLVGYSPTDRSAFVILQYPPSDDKSSREKTSTRQDHRSVSPQGPPPLRNPRRLRSRPQPARSRGQGAARRVGLARRLLRPRRERAALP